MICRKCEQKAVINMRHHKLALCRDHFLEWVPAQVQRTIDKYQMFSLQERILVAVSGGKDSLSLWDILHRLGYQADGIYIDLGINEGIDYSKKSRELAQQFAVQHGLDLHIVSVPENYRATIPQIARETERGRQKPCAVCGLTKRHIMTGAASLEGYHVLVTGHNLDDEVAVLFANTMNWMPGYLVRQEPVLEPHQPGLVRKAKPLCRMYERELAAYALLRPIEYVYEECPFAAGSTTLYYKDIINKMESDRPGMKLNFYLSFLQAKRNGLFAPQADQEASLLHTCPSCGQPTTAPGLCAFCRMMLRFTQPES